MHRVMRKQTPCPSNTGTLVPSICGHLLLLGQGGRGNFLLRMDPPLGICPHDAPPPQTFLDVDFTKYEVWMEPETVCSVFLHVSKPWLFRYREPLEQGTYEEGNKGKGGLVRSEEEFTAWNEAFTSQILHFFTRYSAALPSCAERRAFVAQLLQTARDQPLHPVAMSLMLKILLTIQRQPQVLASAGQGVCWWTRLFLSFFLCRHRSLSRYCRMKNAQGCLAAPEAFSCLLCDWLLVNGRHQGRVNRVPGGEVEGWGGQSFAQQLSISWGGKGGLTPPTHPPRTPPPTSPPPLPLLSDWAKFSPGLQPIKNFLWRLRRNSV